MGNKFKIDFLCVGFQKCATTTLDAILRQHSNVLLPDIKEVHMEEWAYQCENPMYIIHKKFFQNRYSDKKIGIIDPNLQDCEQIIYKYMGTDIKIIFLMRNPVDRLFSYYKMALKLGYKGVYHSTLHGKEITNVRKSFGRYVREELRRENKNPPILWGNYIDTIQRFRMYYKKQNMIFIFFEDLIKSPEKSVQEICRFLSLPYEKLDCDMWEYSGNLISKNDISFKINGKMNSKMENIRCDSKSTVKRFDRINNICNKVSKFTTTINNEHMSENTKRMLEIYYQDSTRKLEEFLDIDLSQKWF